MTFKHKLSRRLAALPFALVLLGLAGACDAAPTEADALIPFESTLAAAVPSAAGAGEPVVTLTKVKVWNEGSRFSRLLGSQSKGRRGVIVEGPTAITTREPNALWRIDYASGPDGWSRGDQLALTDTGSAPVQSPTPSPTPAPAPVASVSVAPSSVSIAIGGTSQLSATLRDSAGTLLTGRTIEWRSGNSSIATVSASGTVTGVAAGNTTVTATSEGRTAAASITVQSPATSPPPPSDTTTAGPRSILFASDFSTGLGTSDNVLRDMDKSLPWALIGGTGLEVVPATGLDFPSANVLRVTAMEGRSGYARLFQTGLPALAIGTSRYYRFYFRAMFPDNLEDSQTHPIEDGNARNWAFAIFHNQGGAGYYTPYIGLDAQLNGWERFRWYLPALRKQVTYRIEVQVHRLTETGFNLHVRVYSATGTTPLYTDADMRNETRTETLADRPTLFLSDPSRLQEFLVGLNGLSGSAWYPSLLHNYQGGFAVCAGNWCGPYQAGEDR